jgi:hypothetical protein
MRWSWLYGVGVVVSSADYTQEQVAVMLRESLETVDSSHRPVHQCGNCACLFICSQGPPEALHVDRWAAVSQSSHTCQCHDLAGEWNPVASQQGSPHVN